MSHICTRCMRKLAFRNGALQGSLAAGSGPLWSTHPQPRLGWQDPSQHTPITSFRRHTAHLSATPAQSIRANGSSTVEHVKEDKQRRSDRGTSVPSPKPPLSIVFTDIVKSTLLWENDAAAMKDAIQIHDSIMRQCSEEYDGYEVKQNGDGFMIAFPTALTAMRFCLDVQTRLMQAPWPEEILDMKPGSEVKESSNLASGATNSADQDEKVLFRGLRLRMSAHWGHDAVCIWNDVTKRMDYLGPMVNRAARFVQATEGGQIVVSKDFLTTLLQATDQESILENIQHENAASQDSEEPSDPASDRQITQEAQIFRIASRKCEVTYLGKYQFEGLAEHQKLYFIVPHALHGRLNHWPRHRHVAGSKGNLLPS